MRKQFEYKTVDGYTGNMDDLGKKGWELVAISVRNGIECFYYKREILPDPIIRDCPETCMEDTQ